MARYSLILIMMSHHFLPSEISSHNDSNLHVPFQILSIDVGGL